MRKFIKGHDKSATTERLIGCTWDMLHEQFENQFEEGMTFDNYAFSHEQESICWWHKNLQPMWGPDNQKKGGAYDEEDKQNLIRRYNEENLS